MPSLDWEKAQSSEAVWWGNCANTYQEETKQREMFAPRLGLSAINHEGKWPTYDLGGRSVIDVGGGPVSILLKCINYSRAIVIDPCGYPDWIRERYREAGEVGIILVNQCAEDMYGEGLRVNEVWIYNVLQHVIDPEAVISSAKKICDVIRIVDFVGTKKDEKHLHSLDACELDDWLGGIGTVEYISQFDADVYHGISKTNGK